MSEQIKVDYIAPIADAHGMANQARRLMKVLNKLCDLKVFGFNPQAVTHRLSSDELALIQSLIVKDERVPDITIQYALPPMFNPRADAYNIGVISWETSKLPCRDINLGNGISPEINNWVKQIQKMDEIWTFSKNAAGAIKKAGFKKPITIIPGPIDTDFFTPDAPVIEQGVVGVTVDHRGQKLDPKFVVGYVADWNERKDIETFISCTLLALPPNDSVVVLKTKDYLGKQNVSEITSNLKKRLMIDVLPKIVVIDKDLSPEELRGLLQTFTVYASTSRGEGLNLPALECMAMEKEIVLPAHSAHLDYAEQGVNANLIGINLEICRTMARNPWYQNDQVWGKVNEVQYLQCLQDLHKKWSTGQLKANKNGRKTIEKSYSEKACTKIIQGRFENIRAPVDS